MVKAVREVEGRSGRKRVERKRGEDGRKEIGGSEQMPTARG